MPEIKKQPAIQKRRKMHSFIPLFVYLSITFAFVSIYSSYIVNADTSFSACGYISSPGVYVLTGDISTVGSDCIVAQTDDIIIDGAGYTITGNIVSESAIAPMTDGQSSVNIKLRNVHVIGDISFLGSAANATVGGNGGNITLENVTTTGNVYSNAGGSNAPQQSGNNGASGGQDISNANGEAGLSGLPGYAGGNAGSITLFNSTVAGYLSATGGYGSVGGDGGSGGYGSSLSTGNGYSGGNGGAGASGGIGGNGGNGGNVYLYGTSTAYYINSVGGDSGRGGHGGAGGNGGNGDYCSNYCTGSNGGNGGAGGNGANSGNSGSGGIAYVSSHSSTQLAQGQSNLQAGSVASGGNIGYGGQNGFGGSGGCDSDGNCGGPGVDGMGGAQGTAGDLGQQGVNGYFSPTIAPVLSYFQVLNGPGTYVAGDTITVLAVFDTNISTSSMTVILNTGRTLVLNQHEYNHLKGSFVVTATDNTPALDVSTSTSSYICDGQGYDCFSGYTFSVPTNIYGQNVVLRGTPPETGGSGTLYPVVLPIPFASSTPATTTVSTTTQATTTIATSTITPVIPATINIPVPTKYDPPRNLSIFTIGEDVKDLQRFLNTHGFPVAMIGPGSYGNETNVFGKATFAALKKFQAAAGLPSTGYFGPLTRFVIFLLRW